MAKELVGIENDGFRAKVIYNDNGLCIYEDLKIGITTIKDLVKPADK